MNKHADILSRHATGEFPDVIAAHLEITPGYVYGVLRDAGVTRQRKPRTRTSEVPAQVRGLLAAGIKPRRAAELLRVSRSYVYRIMQEAETPPPPLTGD